MPDFHNLLQASVLYNCREKYYHGMQLAATEGLKVVQGDALYRFHYGISLILEGRIEAAMRELHTIEEHPDVSLGSLLALKYAYKKEAMPNEDAMLELDMKFSELIKAPTDKALYSAALFHIFISKVDKAKEFCDKLLKSSPHFPEGLIMRGWIELCLLKEKITSDVLKYFETHKNTNPEALFGEAKFYEYKGNFMKALELFNEAIVLFPQYVPALLEKAKVQLALHDWDQVLDTCRRVLNIDSKCIEAHRLIILHLLCEKADYKEAKEKIDLLMTLLHDVEPKNAFLYCESSKLFSRVCGRNCSILQSAFNLIQEAENLDRSNVDYINESAYQCILQDRINDAGRFYRKAAKLDAGSVDCLKGYILIQILEMDLESAEQQLNLYSELNESNVSSDVLFLFFILARKQGKSQSLQLDYLQKCVAEHFKLIEISRDFMPFGIKYYIQFNPDFLLLLSKKAMGYVPDHPIHPGQPFPAPLKSCQIILTQLAKACPGILESVFLMAKLKYYAGDLQDAKLDLEHCLESDVTYADARLMLAKIMFDEGHHKWASQALEIALSHDFEVREQPLFHLLMAKIQKKQGLYEDSLNTLNTGLNILKSKPESSNKPKDYKKFSNFSTNNKLSLYIELIDSYRIAGQQKEATEVLNDAKSLFKGTHEEGRLIIFTAAAELTKGDIDEALIILRGISKEHPYFLESREKMANVYLTYRKDKRLYANCYKEIVDQYPTTQCFMMLGDAYMNIHETEKAVSVYEEALKKNPRDSALGRKLGQALVMTHNFEKAKTYYKAAIKTGGKLELRYDLAHLLCQMNRCKDAEDVINSALTSEKQVNDLSWLKWESKFLFLWSNVLQKMQDEERAMQILNKAWDVQTRVMRRVHVEEPDSVAEESKFSLSICRSLAEIYTTSKPNQAAQFYKEALSFDDSNVEILLALARMEICANNLDSAQQYCQAILKSDSENDSATLLMADIMFRKTDLESAVVHFHHLLARKPDYYGALARYIEAVRRLGILEDVPPYLQKAEEICTQSSFDAGFHYCKGLYEWYTGNTTVAMKCFNKARSDAEWGHIATYHMIEICVKPDCEGSNFETFERSSDVLDEVHSQESAIRTAEKLLSELKNKVGANLETRIMGNFILLAKHNKSDAEDALNDFLQIVSDPQYKDHVGAILGISTGYLILKQAPRARTQLKKVANYSWNFCDAEYLEQAWLLLADIHIKSGKLEMATELLQNVLHHNKSCIKAYDYMGHIMEKEQNHKQASNYYDLAWKQTNKANPVIGYKLAFNYMKAKRYSDAIDVCHEVQMKYPNYPKIKKEILDKSRANLRT